MNKGTRQKEDEEREEMRWRKLRGKMGVSQQKIQREKKKSRKNTTSRKGGKSDARKVKGKYGRKCR